ncbi:MAG: hypothetical protein HRT77_09315 [Halioglobus sp.]|nr:hypothetical protein [Halioglobus sp.]
MWIAPVTIAGPLVAAEIINGHDWALHLEDRVFSAENPPFSQHARVCDIEISSKCLGAADWDALTPQTGWELLAARVKLWDARVGVLPAPPSDQPAVLYYGGYIMNDPMNCTTQLVDGKCIQITDGIFVIAEVARDTVLT